MTKFVRQREHECWIASRFIGSVSEAGNLSIHSFSDRSIASVISLQCHGGIPFKVKVKTERGRISTSSKIRTYIYEAFYCRLASQNASRTALRFRTKYSACFHVRVR
jgi:hypothetical protein